MCRLRASSQTAAPLFSIRPCSLLHPYCLSVTSARITLPTRLTASSADGPPLDQHYPRATCGLPAPAPFDRNLRTMIFNMAARLPSARESTPTQSTRSPRTAPPTTPAVDSAPVNWIPPPSLRTHPTPRRHSASGPSPMPPSAISLQRRHSRVDYVLILRLSVISENQESP